MSEKLQEFDSYDHFKRIVPRNPRDWFGSVVVYSTVNSSFFNIAFGTGDNLDGDDIDEGFNDYIMVDQFETNGEEKLEDILDHVMRTGYVDEYTPGVSQVDGGQWLLRRKDWRNGDIRRFIMEAMDFAGYGLPKGTRKVMFHRDVVYVCADYDNLNDIKHGGNKWRNT